MRVDAPTESEAIAKARRSGHIVDKVIPRAQEGRVSRAGGRSAQSIASTAMVFSVLGWLFVPLAVVGVALGFVAKERSDGECGVPAIVVGAIPLTLFAIVLAVVVFR